MVGDWGLYRGELLVCGENESGKSCGLAYELANSHTFMVLEFCCVAFGEVDVGFGLQTKWRLLGTLLLLRLGFALIVYIICNLYVTKFGYLIYLR